jgi:NAD(P)H-hydrate epimerase
MKKIFTAAQTHELDQYTIQHEPISSIDLMERASKAFVEAFCNLYDTESSVVIWCGTGNNGGDGLAIARLLEGRNYQVNVIQAMIGKASEENSTNQERLPKTVPYRRIQKGEELPEVNESAVAIDALFGSGLSRPVEGYWATVVAYINANFDEIVAIDLPSGLYADQAAEGTIIQATHTISFERPKLSFFFAEHAKYVGKWQIVNIELSKAGMEEQSSSHYFLDDKGIAPLLKIRQRFDHKGTYGHALVVAGSYGKMGAAVLSARSCLHAGAGLLSVHIPKIGYAILQISLPEAMVLVDRNDYLLTEVTTEVKQYKAIGIGPGLGTDPLSVQAVEKLLKAAKRPLVIDADALNILAKNKPFFQHLPKNSILTPHPKEFDRLFGEHTTNWARWQTQKEQSRLLNCVIVLKGGHTSITTPQDNTYFSTAGNPGMGTAGSGDVLTGILTGLMAQGYESEEAACLGVHLHGMAGDLAAQEESMESLIAGQLIEYLGKAFQQLRHQL